MPLESQEFEELYDVELTAIDMEKKQIEFTCRNRSGVARLNHHYRYHVDTPQFWHLNIIGRLRTFSRNDWFEFEPYLDQRLRRHEESDDPVAQLWGWEISNPHWVLLEKAGVIPHQTGLSSR